MVFFSFDDPLYRAHLERYAAAAAVSLASSSYPSSAALMSSYNPALFSQLLPPQPLSRVTSHMSPGHHTLATASPGHHRSNLDTSKKSGNANAPSSIVPGREGPIFSLTIVSIAIFLGATIIKISITALHQGHVIIIDFYIILYLLL